MSTSWFATIEPFSFVMLQKSHEKIATLALLTIMLNANAQKPVLVYQYCELTANPRLVTSNPNIWLNFGNKVLQRKFKPLSDSIHNMSQPVEALNFMAQNGWTLVKYYIEEEGASSSRFYRIYLLRKKFQPKDLR
ncbi:hypothetical protein [Niabella hibiscisoli]|uniref:hypothetical protein n=1 Tax=Niabella hibiscisoli TaxID=1825928 RepID=UPI001F0D1832|nr:hypothetical protein [Niabella hibiscisoli]MCH5714752.1 hypothetical protein [Niabella hibiscisoli]